MTYDAHTKIIVPEDGPYKGQTLTGKVIGNRFCSEMDNGKTVVHEYRCETKEFGTEEPPTNVVYTKTQDGWYYCLNLEGSGNDTL